MKKIIQKYPLSKSLRTMLMAALVLCACQTYAGDYYVSNSWISNGVGYFSLVSYDCNQSTTVQCVEANDALPPTGHYYYSQGNYFYPNNDYYQTGYGNPVECCTAAWDHVNAGQDADCGSCNGSMIVDGNYNLTGKFNVRYRYNGQTYEVGPYTTPGDITINHLCAGTYTHITIVGAYTGCEAEWPHDVVIGGGSNIHVDAGHDQSICRGESVQLCATGASHYEWSNGHTGSCITVSPHQSTTYSVTGTSNGCTDTDHVSVHVNDAAWDNVEKGHNASCGSCDGSIIVNGDYSVTGKFKVRYRYNGQNYQEGPFTTGSDITLDHLCAGTYTNIKIVGVDTGCEEVWPHDITIGGGDNLHVDAGHDQSICRGESIQLCATGADHYEWSNGHTGACITVSPHQDTNYSVTGTSGDCTDTDHVSVHVNDAAWDNVEKGHDASCGSCDGSIIINGDYSVTGTFKVRYKYNGQSQQEGPFNTGSDIVLDHLCPGEYTDIKIVGTDSGCSEVWPHDITIGEEDCCPVDISGGSIVIPASGSGGTPTTEATICVDGVPDPIDVEVTGAVGSNFAWVITDADLNILALPPAPPFDLDGAGIGTCLIWYLAYENVEGAMVGMNAADLSGCFDLSNPITVDRVECCDEEGGEIVIAAGSGGAGGVETNICVDGTPDPIDVTVSGASATNSAWVITDADLNILALPGAPPFDLDGAGEGVCLIWYLAYETIQGAEVGANAGDLSGCFDLSNPITVTRTCCDANGDPISCEEVCEEEGGTIEIPGDGSGGGVDAVNICVDGVPDPLDVNVTGASGTNFAWVITDADLNILALPPAPPFDLDGAGEGVCLIWYLAFDEVSGAEVGANAGDLEGCFDLSNPITVTRTCCDADGNPADCPTDECENYTLDFNDPHTDWHAYSTSGSYTVGNQTFDINIENDDHILAYTNESNAGITVGIEPNNRDDVVVITYTLSEIASGIAFDIVDLDYKTGGSRQQEKVCVYGLLGNDDTQIMPTIESLDGSVAISGNCATATTNSAYGHDESVLVTFEECIDQIVIVYGSGPDAPHDPDYSKIHIGKDLGFSTDVCPGQCTAPQTCEDYTLDFEDNGVRWHDNASSDEYDLGGQNISINIEDNDHIVELTTEDHSGLQVGIEPDHRNDEVVITYTLSEVSSHVLFDIVDLDYKTGGSKQQEKVCVYGLLGDDNTQIMPNITSLDGSVAISGNCATATTNSAYGHDESVLVEFTECIDQIVIVYGSGPDAPHNPSYSKITIGEDYGFTTEVCPDACEASGSQPREDESYVADVSIFPNPAESLVTISIESELEGTANVVMIDALGRTVSNLPIALTGSLTQYQLDASNLSSGVYFVTVFTQEGRSKAQQLVIARP